TRRLSNFNRHFWLRWKNIRHRQRFPRAALRRRPAASYSPTHSSKNRAAVRDQDRQRPRNEAPRPPAGLSPQNQLLRRLDHRHVGAIHPRPDDSPAVVGVGFGAIAQLVAAELRSWGAV